MKSWILALPLTATCLAPAPAATQAKPIDIYVSVVNAKGEAVPGLSAEDFVVRENGVAREVLKVAPATDAMDVAILVDDSQATTDAIQFIREGLHDLVRTLAGKATMALVTYGERPTILVAYTTDQKKLLDGIDHIFPRPGSGAYLLDALVEVSRGFQKRSSTRPVIVAVGTEAVEFSTLYYTKVTQDLEKSRATFHMLALGEEQSGSDENRNRNQVVAIGTEHTGGRRDQILTPSALPNRLKQLADELTHQYVVTYARPDALIPPEKVEVTVKRPGLTARARTRTVSK